MTIPQFQKTVLDWYKQNGRELPWRNTRDPYKILVSEIMLQQTQISRVLPKYEEFLRAFPTPETLAKASDKKLLKAWAGLGYWRRAKYLKETAKNVTGARTAGLRRRVGPRAKRGVKRDEKPQSERKFPRSPERLEKFSGIGHYTARAVACFAFSNTNAFLDTNIRRVYLHFFFPRKEKVADKEILNMAQGAIDTLPKGVTPREWHYALFDYGALALKDKSINKRSRAYAKQSKFEGSFRSWRTKVVRFLLVQPNSRATHRQVRNLLKASPYDAQEIITALLKDNLIKKSQKHYSL